MRNRFLFYLLIFTVVAETIIAQESPVSKDDKNPFDEDDLYLSLHMGFNKDHIITSEDQIKGLKFDRPTLPSLIAVLDFELEDRRSFIIRLEAGYKRINFHAHAEADENIYTDYVFKGHSLVPAVFLLYRVPFRGKLRPYGGLGVGFAISHISKNKMTVNYNISSRGIQMESYEKKLDLDGDQGAILFTFGFMYGKRFDMNCRFLRSKFNRSDDTRHKLKNRPMIFSVGYRI